MVMGFDSARSDCMWKVKGARRFLRVRVHEDDCFEDEILLLFGVRGMGGEFGVMWAELFCGD